MLTTELALKRYEMASVSGDGWREAAEALAAVLMARAPKAKRAPALTDPIKVGRKAKHWGDFVIAWVDGTQTLVRGVIYDRPADRWAAAYQAADRLRRLRGRHGWEGEEHPETGARAPSRWHRVSGIRRETPDFWRYAMRERPMPAPVSILAEDGETFDVQN